MPTIIDGGDVQLGTINGYAPVTDGNIGTKTAYMAQSCYYLPVNWRYAITRNVNQIAAVVNTALPVAWPAD
jgi:hypothetical protein